MIARDAFNGTILWKRPIKEWQTHLWPLKSGPSQQPRRLVAVGDKVYVTLGIDGPVTALDAATGETLRTYAGTEETEEILYSDGRLYLLAVHEKRTWAAPESGYATIDAIKKDGRERPFDDHRPRRILTVDAETGKTLWAKGKRGHSTFSEK